LPLLSGLEVSFSQPVYSMVTSCPFCGMAPSPSVIVVLVTPMMTVRRLGVKIELECSVLGMDSKVVEVEGEMYKKLT
jgi:hypothetical protein